MAYKSLGYHRLSWSIPTDTDLSRGFAAAIFMTIGLTTTEVTNNSDVDDGAADHGMDCTWLTARHTPVIAPLPSPDSGSRGAGFVSQRSLHTPTIGG